jgi:hypothetical protein
MGNMEERSKRGQGMEAVKERGLGMKILKNIFCRHFNPLYILKKQTMRHDAYINVLTRLDSLTLEMEALCCPEMLVTIYQLTWCNIPEDLNLL